MGPNLLYWSKITLLRTEAVSETKHCPHSTSQLTSEQPFGFFFFFFFVNFKGQCRFFSFLPKYD